MATRRPKVPRATPAAPESVDTDDGADVIPADFGRARGTAAPGTNQGATPRQPASSGARPGRPAAGKPASGTATPGKAASGKAAAGEAAPGTATAGKAAPGRRWVAKTPAGGEVTDQGITPVPAKAFSGRLLALSVVMIAITILLAPTVKIFVDKRAEIAALEADIAERQATRDDLKRQVSRWQDPNYVKQQARDRINMVMPGETGYWVFGSDIPATDTGSTAAAAATQDPANLPWVDALWDSIRRSATD